MRRAASWRPQGPCRPERLDALLPHKIFPRPKPAYPNSTLPLSEASNPAHARTAHRLYEHKQFFVQGVIWKRETRSTSWGASELGKERLGRSDLVPELSTPLDVTTTTIPPTRGPHQRVQGGAKEVTEPQGGRHEGSGLISGTYA